MGASNTFDIRIKQQTNEHLEDVYFSTTEYARFEFPRHFHEYYTILIVEEGINQGFTEKHKYTLGSGSMLIINPGEVHAGNSYAGETLKFRSLTLEENFLKKILAEQEVDCSGDLVFCNQPLQDKQLSQKFTALLDTFDHNLSPVVAQTRALDFLFDLFHRYVSASIKLPSRQPDLSYLKRARDFITDHYQQEMTLQEIAKSAYISEFHLVRQFQKYFGLTPFEYLRNYRIEKAKTLLKQKKSITEVALTVGFYDHSHFLKNFKKLTGMLPSQYRNNL